LIIYSFCKKPSPKGHHIDLILLVLEFYVIERFKFYLLLKMIVVYKKPTAEFFGMSLLFKDPFYSNYPLAPGISQFLFDHYYFSAITLPVVCTQEAHRSPFPFVQWSRSES